MKVWISNLDTLAGRALTRSFFFIGAEVAGTILNEDDRSLIDERVQEIYEPSDDDDFLARVIDCSVIISSLHDPERAVSLAEHIAEFAPDKILITLSTIMTWANTQPYEQPVKDALDEEEEEEPEEEDEEEEGTPKEEKKPVLGISEDHYLDRKPHPAYTAHLSAERRIARKYRDGLPGFIVASGILYGAGEDSLHSMFKAAWEGGVVSVATPSDRILPLIHSTDFANTVVAATRDPPEGHYILATDTKLYTARAVADAIVDRLGVGSAVEEVPMDAALVAGMPLPLSVDINVFPGFVNELNIPRVAPEGFVPAINTAADEYLHCRGLEPLCVYITGQPGIGKTTTAEMVATEYGLTHLNLPTILAQVSERADKVGVQTKALLDQKKRIPAEQLAVIVRHYMVHTPAVVERGYVLDGYPKTAAEAKALFTVPHNTVSLDAGEQRAWEEEQEALREEEVEEEEEEDEDEDKEPSDLNGAAMAVSARTKKCVALPTIAIKLIAAPDVAKNRVMSIPKKDTVGTHHNEKDHGRRTTLYADNCGPSDGTEAKGPLAAVAELGSRFVCIDASNEDPEVVAKAMVDAIGVAHVYQPTRAELEAKEREEEAKRQAAREADEKAAAEEQARFEQEIEEARRSNAVRRDKIIEAEQAELEACATPLIQYLDNTVMNIVTEGLKQVAAERPENPIRALGEYLFRHVPTGNGYPDEEM
ncbi:Adenylate kinase/UMP-CMP kinase [Carpediemonas membranifera]|uniref:Adenylate kinase/UMP-CMP kinase n=1 Tax=Carpediemonas membranifera TaxID=201153 RepID=A0A8J6BVY3_9EUKA|nr:Adenylate kinase/UMP-CMP kinase [Carpediemonas membranifera]|eukprot:KAG9391881.1 Adenylate kinase/UMP-CMP kinase [Carpediemonas membranifera]